MLLCKFHRRLGSAFSHVTGIVNTNIEPSGCGVAFADVLLLYFTAYDVGGREHVGYIRRGHWVL